MTTGKVLVTGASGNAGGELVKALLERGWAVRGATRDVDRVAGAGPAGCEWTPFDFDRPDTFQAALEGVDRVFLVAPPGDMAPERTVGPFVDAARGSGVERIVSLSAMGAERREDVPLGRMEALVEEAVPAWTHLRPNWFMQIFAVHPLVAGIRSAGRIAVPAGDARISWIDARDIAEVAAATLCEPGHEERAYTLTGGEALDHRAVADMLSRSTCRRIEYRSLDEGEAREAILEAGLGPTRADRLLGFYRLVRDGACAPVSPDVEAVLSRPPRTMERFARDYADVWGAA